jgi:hypothetical protein
MTDFTPSPYCVGTAHARHEVYKELPNDPTYCRVGICTRTSCQGKRYYSRKDAHKFNDLIFEAQERLKLVDKMKKGG